MGVSRQNTLPTAASADYATGERATVHNKLRKMSRVLHSTTPLSTRDDSDQRQPLL